MFNLSFPVLKLARATSVPFLHTMRRKLSNPRNPRNANAIPVEHKKLTYNLGWFPIRDWSDFSQRNGV
jgi:hypothetical protein